MSKLAVEKILADFSSAYGFQWSALRYFYASAADPEAGLGEFRTNETHLIPRAMMWIQGHLEDFRIFGTDFPTHDGTAVRDYIHVRDLARAHVLSLQLLLSGGRCGPLNLGSGQGYSVKEVLSEISRTAKSYVPIARSPPETRGSPRINC
jgi:UDP-glucose 4-epimerase